MYYEFKKHLSINSAKFPINYFFNFCTIIPLCLNLYPDGQSSECNQIHEADTYNWCILPSLNV